MGTNYYINSKKYDDISGHIGKRSAAGFYCWDCAVTLCAEGPGHVHTSNSHWLEFCPKCGAGKPKEEDLSISSAGRELGFNKTKPKKKKGIASCSSFAWGIYPHELDQIFKKLKLKYPVINEYDEKLTEGDFLDILEECPLQSFGLIGTKFS